MAVIRKRNRLVSFRVSEQEYEALQNSTVNEGARSISDFARAALAGFLNGESAGVNAQPEGAGVNQTLEKLATTMGELNRVISRLSILVEGNSNKSSGQVD